MNNSLNSALIVYLDNYGNYETFNSQKDVEEAISSFYEEFWERNFELHEQNHTKFEEAQEKIKKLAQEYIIEKNLKF